MSAPSLRWQSFNMILQTSGAPGRDTIPAKYAETYR
jgi:hypothetical protein